MKRKTRSVQLPHQTRSLSMRSKTADEEKRTIEVVWGTGAKGLRYGWDGAFYEELSMDPKHVSLKRLKGGAQVLDNHRSWQGLDGVIGVIEDAWLEGEEGVARLRLSDREEIRGITDDILKGIIRNLSIGYSIRKMVQVGEENGVPTLRAEDWEPYEISFVTVPFDEKAQSRSAEVGERFSECTIIVDEHEESEQMKTKEELEAERLAAEQATRKAQEEAVRLALEADRKRAGEIRSAVSKAGLEASFADTLIEQGVDINVAREKILDGMADVSRKHASVTVTPGALDENVTAVRALEEHLLVRMAPQLHKPTELSSRLRSASLLDLGRASLRRQGVNPDMFSKNEIATRALHTSSDFASTLSSNTKKVLTQFYEGAPADWDFLTVPQGMSDYKTLTRVGLSTGPQLLEVKEHAEYKRGTLSDSAEFLNLKKYGRILGITREMLINDDLNAFSNLPRMWGLSCRNLESDLILNQILGNPTMGDGNALFSVAHGNLAAAPSALDLTNLNLAVTAIETQKGYNSADGSGSNYLRLRAKYLIVGSALKLAAKQLTTSIDPVTFQTVNPFSDLVVVSDPSITGNQWYVAADPAAGFNTIAKMYLEGEQGPQLDERAGFDVDGIEYKVRLDTGAKVLDWRWIYKNAGV